MKSLGEKCAIFGVFGHGLDVARLTFFGLFALQHRGQESSGIAVSDGARIASHRKMGLVTQVYKEDTMRLLTGHIAIGHNRYSTSKTSTLKYAQPILGAAPLATAHNGNLPSVSALEKFLRQENINTANKSDSELMTAAINFHLEKGLPLPEAMMKSLPLFTGAFSFLAMDKTTLIAVRDQCGIRPLSIGTLNGGFIFSSETCALQTVGAEFLRDVEPGEMVIVDERGLRCVRFAKADPKFDIFEFVYFARPDSYIGERSVYEMRRRCGTILAKEYPVKADVVIPVPETGIPAAIGYARATGIPFEIGLVKNRYIYRTFIEPEEHLREQGVRAKLTPLPHILKGKRVAILDDSIVRGTTSREIVKLLFASGAKEVHFLVCCPPIRYPDFYGIDIPNQKKLLAFNRTVKEMNQFIGATSLHFLSYKGLIAATGRPESTFCTACFTGRYPIDIKERATDFTPQDEKTRSEERKGRTSRILANVKLSKAGKSTARA